MEIAWTHLSHVATAIGAIVLAVIVAAGVASVAAFLRLLVLRRREP